MKTKIKNKKIEAATAIIAVVLALLIIGVPTMIADTTPPTPPQIQGPQYMGEVTITLTASDGGTGVAKTYYRFIPSATGEWIEYDGPIPVSTLGQNEMEYYSVDLAGNNETVKTQYFYIHDIDVTPPNTEIDIDGDLLQE